MPLRFRFEDYQLSSICMTTVSAKTKLTLLYGGMGVQPHMLSKAAFHLAVDAASGGGSTVAFLCLQKSRLWVQRLALLHDVNHVIGSALHCTHNPFSPLEAGGEALLRDLVREQSPSLVVIDNLGKLKPAQADQVSLQEADKADREALALIRSAVEGFDVEAFVVHHVDFVYAHELRRDGHVDAVEQADTPASPWMRGATVQAKSRETSA